MENFFARRTSWSLAPNRYSLALDAHRRSGRPLLDLTASNPTTVGLRYNEAALLAAMGNPRALVYEPTAMGLLAAREAVAAYYGEKGIRISADDLLLTTSTSEAYSFAFRLLCEPGDSVLVPTPSYPLFEFLADLQDVRLAPYELVYDHGWQVDLHSLAEAMEKAQAAGSRCRAILVVHPNNPTGSFVKRHEATELNAICAAQDMAIIADEVFLDYSLAEETPSSFAASHDVLSLTLSGISKVSALPQMKVAWMAVSGPEARKREALSRLEVIADTYLSMSAPMQWATATLLEERRNVQPQLMQRLRQNLAELDRQLPTQQAVRRLAVEGGWYAVLRVPALGSDEDFAIALLEATGVLVQPGHFYDFVADGYLVLSLITAVEEFAIGVERLLDYVRQCGR